jgi:hypothetical protein
MINLTIWQNDYDYVYIFSNGELLAVIGNTEVGHEMAGLV